MKYYSKIITGRKEGVCEDSLYCNPDQGLFIISDGASGFYGDSSSIKATVELGRLLEVDLRKSPADHKIADVLRHRIEQVNQNLINFGGRATLELLLLTEESAHLIHIGDGRIYALDNNAIAQCVGMEKKYAQDEPEKTIVSTPDTGPTNYLGLSQCNIQYTKIPLWKNGTRSIKYFFAATDGLLKRASGKEIATVLVTKQDQPQAVLAALAQFVALPNDMMTYALRYNPKALPLIESHLPELIFREFQESYDLKASAEERVKKFLSFAEKSGKNHQRLREIVSQLLEFDDTGMVLIDLDDVEEKKMTTLLQQRETLLQVQEKVQQKLSAGIPNLISGNAEVPLPELAAALVTNYQQQQRELTDLQQDRNQALEKLASYSTAASVTQRITAVKLRLERAEAFRMRIENLLGKPEDPEKSILNLQGLAEAKTQTLEQLYEELGVGKEALFTDALEKISTLVSAEQRYEELRKLVAADSPLATPNELAEKVRRSMLDQISMQISMKVCSKAIADSLGHEITDLALATEELTANRQRDVEYLQKVRDTIGLPGADHREVISKLETLKLDSQKFGRIYDLLGESAEARITQLLDLERKRDEEKNYRWKKYWQGITKKILLHKRSAASIILASTVTVMTGAYYASQHWPEIAQIGHAFSLQPARQDQSDERDIRRSISKSLDDCMARFKPSCLSDFPKPGEEKFNHLTMYDILQLNAQLDQCYNKKWQNLEECLKKKISQR